MQNLAMEVERLGRIYTVHGGKQERSFRKELIALLDVTSAFRDGEPFGLLGPNGAGKTSRINS